MTGRRTKLEVVLEILRITEMPRKPTNLMYATNLSWVTFTRIVETMKDKGLLIEVGPEPATINPNTIRENREPLKDHRSRIRYQRTEIGTKLLTDMGKMEELLYF